MGAAHNRKLIKNNIGVLILSMVALLAFSVYSRLNDEIFAKLFAYYSVFVVMQAVMLFELVATMRVRVGILNKFLLEIADKSFGIYLVHMVFINMMYQALKMNPMKYGLIGAVVLVVVNLVISYFITCVMKKIPILNKYV